MGSEESLKSNDNKELQEQEITTGEELLKPSLQKNKSKILSIIVLIAIIITGGVFLYVIAGDNFFKDYAIKVNSQALEREEFNRIYNNEIERVKEFFKKQNKPFDPKSNEAKKIENEIKNMIIEQLSVRLLLLDDAIKKGYSADDKEIEAQINAFKVKMGQENFNDMLKKQNLTTDYIKGDIKKRIIVQKYLDDKVKGIKINDTVAEAYFNQNREKYRHPEMIRASHILLKTEEEAKKVLKELKGGVDFAKLAEKYSIDPSAKYNKGDLNFFPRGVMVPEFERAAFSTSVGKISNIIKTRFGYHIIKVTEKREARDVKFAEIKDVIKKEMTSNKQKSLIDETIKKLKEKAKIDVRV